MTDLTDHGAPVAPAQPIRMIGTDGGRTYLVVARNGDVGLGLRFLLQPRYGSKDASGNPRITLLCRVRSAAFPTEDCDESLVVTDKEITGSWMDLPFENFPQDENRRASVYSGFHFQTAFPDDIVNAAGEVRLASKIHSWLSQFVAPEHFLLEYDAFVTAIHSELAKAASNTYSSGAPSEIALIATKDEGVATKLVEIKKAHQEAVDHATTVFNNAIELVNSETATISLGLVEDYKAANPGVVISEAEKSDREFGTLNTLRAAEDTDDESDYSDSDEVPQYDA